MPYKRLSIIFEIDVVITEGVLGFFSVYGSSSRKDLCDNEMDYFGKGVFKAIGYINGKLCHELIGTSVFKQNSHILWEEFKGCFYFTCSNDGGVDIIPVIYVYGA